VVICQGRRYSAAGILREGEGMDVNIWFVLLQNGKSNLASSDYWCDKSRK
jgi:hypothetical protein